MDKAVNSNQEVSNTPDFTLAEKLKRFFSSVILYIKTHKKYYILSAAVILLAGSCIATFYIYQSKINKNSISQSLTYEKNTPSPTPRPTPIPLIPDSGTKGTYQVSQGKHQGPTFTQVIFDPLNVQKGQILEIQVTTKADIPAEKIIGTLQTDNFQIDLSFEKVTEDGNSETWQTSFKLTDTVFYKYILTLSAVKGLDISKVIVAPRS